MVDKNKAFKDYLKKLADNPKFIAGIYNYCDRWCERCSFTSRCMNYELGEVQFDDLESHDIKNANFWEKLGDTFQIVFEMLKEDAEKMGCDLDNIYYKDADNEEKLKRETAEDHECCRAAEAYAKMVDSWFDSRKGLI